MRPPHRCPSNLSSLLLLLLPSLAITYTLDCSDIRVKDKSFNLKPLDGAHSIYRIRQHGAILTNTTFTIDVCRPLEKKKGVPSGEDCPMNSRVCAIEQLTNTVEHINMPGNPIPIAGDYSLTTGGDLNPHWTRLKASASSEDREKEGLRLEMGGGKFENRKQKAIIEFLCLPDRNDGVTRRDEILDAYDEDEKGDDDSGEETDDEHGGKLKLHSWKDEEDVKVLRLDWYTQYACEDAKDSGEVSNSGHWGFFTWFIIIVFMAVAAYLIFGSWLNYNRYSARGWDLVPHSETIRDIPYLFRDWIRRIVNTVQGGGSRGGYSAV